ncbi:MAG: DUF3142 domain-containing protein [Fimbriimonas sp.]
MLPRRLPWLVVPLVFAGCRAAPPVAPPEIGMWYWHTPFRVEAAEKQLLDEIGVRTLYVRGGTFTTDGKRAILAFPQRWEGSTRGLDAVLTLNFDGGLVSHLEEIPAEALARDVAKGIRQATEAAAKVGVRFKGVQLDIDCPTRVLPRYAELLRAVRPHVKGSFSITALPTWITSSKLEEVADAVDFIVPQFYEGRTGRTLDDLQPVSDAAALRKGLDRLGRMGRPFHAGLAAYGHAMLFTREGRLTAMYRGLSPEDAMRHPSLRFEAAGPLGDSGEDRLVMRALRPDANGRGQGYQIAYTLPTAAMVRRQIQAFREARPANARGFILYRFPEPEEAMALPLRSVRSAFRPEPAKPSLDVKLESKAVPWALIGKDAEGGVARDLTVKAVATGEVGTAATPGAVTVVVELDRPGVEGAAPGDFDEVRLGRVEADGTLRTASPARANAVMLTRHHLLPGQRLRSGAIEIGSDGAKRARLRWTVKPTGTGDLIRAESSEIGLEAKK